ncbi:MAG: O-antigen ligase family protein [Bacteroidetes bacterium]|nr:O-antigen ligase family protein [Bacteroidota bacterium]
MIQSLSIFSEDDTRLKKILVALLVLVCFSLPFKDYLFVNPLIFLSILVWLLGNPFKKAAVKNPNFPILVALLLFFCLHVVALFYTKNASGGASNVEIKLSFLVFPLLFYTERFSEKQRRSFMQSFVLGNLVLYVLCLCRAFWFLFTAHENWFFYTDVSWLQHPSYLSMYATFCCLVCLYYNLFPKRSVVLFVFFATLMVILLSSKAGIFIHVALLTAFFFSRFVTQKNRVKNTGIALLLLLIFISLLFLLPETKKRLTLFSQEIENKNTATDTKESTSLRMQIWALSADIIKEHPVAGVAPGDVQEELTKKYLEHDLVSGYEFQRNAHNQYLQTTLGLGLLGLCSLLSLFVLPLLKNKNTMIVFFLLLTFFHFVPESMLQTMAGTIFFVFFYCLLCFKNPPATS